MTPRQQGWDAAKEEADGGPDAMNPFVWWESGEYPDWAEFECGWGEYQGGWDRPNDV